MKFDKFHKAFQLNGISFSSVDELLLYAHGFSDEIYRFLETWFSEDFFIHVKTSGSTGNPKKIKLQKEQMIHSAFATGKYFNLKERTTALLCLHVDFIAGKMMLVRALTLGWHLDVVNPNSSPLKGLKKKYDFSALVPLQLENSIDSLHLIKKIIVGGGEVSRQLQNKLQTLSTNVYATYGMTETITHIAVKKLNNLFFQGEMTMQGLHEEYYQTLPNVEIYKDARNCLVIVAPKISKNVIFTNDIVQLISDTQFQWLGRFDTVINSGGVKLYPERIEEKLAKIMTSRFFVAGITDQILGKKLILLVELETNNILKEKQFINAEIKKLASLSKYEIPKEIYFIAAFTETPTKKIQRKKTLSLIIT